MESYNTHRPALIDITFKRYRLVPENISIAMVFSVLLAQSSLLSKLAKNRRAVLLPPGEGGPAKREPDRAKPQEKGRMRARIDAFPNPHPALRATLSRREGTYRHMTA